jgi:hypothetical protein
MKPPEEAVQGLGFIEQLKEGGLTAALIGMAGMVARLLLSNEEGMTWGKAARHVLAAGIVAWLVNQGLKEVAMAEGLKTASLGVAGATATHIVDFAVEWVKARGKAEVAKLSPKKGPTRAKRKSIR